MKKLILSAFALAAFGFSASAAQLATANASAALINQVSITTDLAGFTVPANVAGGALVFGNITVGGTLGEVSISAVGARTSSGGVEILNTVVDPTAAGFAVTGSAEGTYTVGLPANGAVTLSGTGLPLVVKDFTASASAGTLDGTGKQLFSVGATLEIPASHSTGSFTGTFEVTVAYN